MLRRIGHGVFREIVRMAYEMARYEWADRNALLVVPGIIAIPRLITYKSDPLFIIRGGRMIVEVKGICLTSVKIEDKSLRITLCRAFPFENLYMLTVVSVHAGEETRTDILFGDHDRVEPLLEEELIKNIHVTMRHLLWSRWFTREAITLMQEGASLPKELEWVPSYDPDRLWS